MRPLLLGLFLLFEATAAHAAPPADARFQAIFDGSSLDGWLGQDMSFWSIEDAAITGTITADHAPAMNQYLVWQGGLVEDFELKLDFRLTGSTTAQTNGGFQFRSRRLPNGDVAGYQVDNNFGQPWKARLYDEFGRHDLALEGQIARLLPQKRDVQPLELEPGAGDFRLDQWHEYHLRAAGRKLTLAVNGKRIAECQDDDPYQWEPSGILAMQLHTGPPMRAQFRHIRLKRLAAGSSLSPRDQLLARSALHWQVGEPEYAQQPPLTAHGKIDLAGGAGTQADRARARDHEAAALDGGYFDAGADWNTTGSQITVFVRALAGGGDWNQPLFSKRSGHDSPNFNLFGGQLPGTQGTHLGFEIRTDRGLFQVTFPTRAIETARWHDLIGRYDGRTIQILCDGKVMASRPAAGNLLGNRAPLLIGAETDAGQVTRTFRGRIAEVALWTSALSAEMCRLLSESHADGP